MTNEHSKPARLEWLRRVYCFDADAMSDAQADQHLFDRMNDFGLEHFVENYRPLQKLKQARGELNFTLGKIEHRDPDRTYAQLLLGNDVVFELAVRFEDESPFRVKYWMSYPPLPDGLLMRAYTPADAPGCVALEQACPMEMINGDQWTVDRGVHFHDYLELMDSVDAAVVVSDDRIVGFYSCALRPINYQDQSSYCVYQHHYRVHPDFRAGSVSQALGSFVDPRRSFEAYDVQFPYSMVDPENAHMQHMGFPAAEQVRIARLSLPLDGRVGSSYVTRPSAAEICQILNTTHGGRSLFQPYTEERLQARTSKIGSYTLQSFLGDHAAVLGVWAINERNVLTREGTQTESRTAFVLDYGYRSIDALVERIKDIAPDLRAQGATHLGFLCDQRAEEYAALKSLAADEQLLAVHTLPWTTHAFTDQTVYCDAIYC